MAISAYIIRPVKWVTIKLNLAVCRRRLAADSTINRNNHAGRALSLTVPPVELAARKQALLAREAIMCADQSLGRKDRLRLRADFKRVYSTGKRCTDGTLVVYAAANGLSRSRVGISIGRSVGGAVVRNRIRRRIRETFRTSRDVIPAGFDIVCVVSPQAAGAGYDLPPSLIRLVRDASAARRRQRDRRSASQ